MADDLSFQQKIWEAQQLAASLKVALQTAMSTGVSDQPVERITALREATRDVEWVELQIKKLIDEA